MNFSKVFGPIVLGKILKIPVPKLGHSCCYSLPCSIYPTSPTTTSSSHFSWSLLSTKCFISHLVFPDVGPQTQKYHKKSELLPSLWTRQISQAHVSFSLQIDLAYLRNIPANHNNLSNVRRDKYDDCTEERYRCISTTKEMAAADVERSVNSVIWTVVNELDDIRTDDCT
jgi:hypothetical protein